MISNNFKYSLRLCKNQLIFVQKFRNYVTSAEARTEKTESSGRKMHGWQINSYGNLDKLEYSENIKIPIINRATDILIKVLASGVNPIDIAMISGYGSKIINALRCNHDGTEFPLTLGREFCGIIVQKGLGSDGNLSIGDKVWGVVPIQNPGSHAEYVVVSQSCISKIPKELETIDASSILYAGLTAWSGLFISGQLGSNECSRSNSVSPNKRVLVLGASGAVGGFAVQILKAEGVTVIGTCSTDAVPLVQSLGVDHVIDYTRQDEINDFVTYGPYDIILDCAGQGPEYAHRFGWKFNSYITFSSPLLKNVDNYGFGVGMARNLVDLFENNVKTITKQGCIKWGYFVPSPKGIEYLKNLVERKKLLPVIDSIYNFKNAIEAYKKVQSGHLRGKVIINFKEI